MFVYKAATLTANDVTDETLEAVAQNIGYEAVAYDGEMRQYDVEEVLEYLKQKRPDSVADIQFFEKLVADDILEINFNITPYHNLYSSEFLTHRNTAPLVR